jgi:hypothetical protein
VRLAVNEGRLILGARNKRDPVSLGGDGVQGGNREMLLDGKKRAI